MKKLAWLVLLVLLLNSADEPVKLIQLTLINKSKMPIGVRLVGQSDYDFFYYLQVPKGDRDNPQEKTFTIAEAYYYMQVFYVETWDPVYGFDCQPAYPNELHAFRNIRVVFLPCNFIPLRYVDKNNDNVPDLRLPNFGESSMRKYLPYPVFNPICLLTGGIKLGPPACLGYGVFRYIY